MTVAKPYAATLVVSLAAYLTSAVCACGDIGLSLVQVHVALRPAVNATQRMPDMETSCVNDTHFFDKDDCGIFKSGELCEQRRKQITWLASFPGSGNTWTRTLLEKTTGIFTGSMYDDESLVEEEMLGEGVMDPAEILVVKTHARNASALPTQGHRALVLVRAPLDAALSRIQIHFADKLGMNMHNGEVPLKDLRKKFDRKRDVGLIQWKEHLSYWDQFPGEHIIIRYEDLVSDTRGTLTNQILPFMGIDVSTVQSRLDCVTTETESAIQRNHSYEFEFTEEDRAAAKTILGDFVEKFGYTV